MTNNVPLWYAGMLINVGKDIKPVMERQVFSCSFWLYLGRSYRCIFFSLLSRFMVVGQWLWAWLVPEYQKWLKNFIYYLVLLHCPLATSHETGQNPEISEKDKSKIYLIVHNWWLSAMRHALCVTVMRFPCRPLWDRRNFGKILCNIKFMHHEHMHYEIVDCTLLIATTTTHVIYSRITFLSYPSPSLYLF